MKSAPSLALLWVFFLSLSASAQTPTTSVRPLVSRGDGFTERTHPHAETGNTRSRGHRSSFGGTFGGGYVASDNAPTHSFLLRASFVGAADFEATPPEGDRQDPCMYLIAETHASALLGGDPTQLTALNVRLTPIAVGCDEETVAEGVAQYGAYTFHLGPWSAQHDTRLGVGHRVSLDVIGVEGNVSVTPTPQFNFFVRGFASLLGFVVANQRFTVDRAGFHGLRAEGVVGANWVLGEAVSIGLRAGAGFDIGVLAPGNGRSEDGISNQDIFLRFVANVLGYVSLFAEASFTNSWDNQSGNAGAGMLVGGLEVSGF